MILKKFLSFKFVTAFMSLVLLANLLMPAIAGATVKRDSFLALFSVICTASGLKIVDANGNNPSAPIHNQRESVHCALCVVGGAPSLPCQTASFVTLFQGALVFDPPAIYPLPLNTYWPSASPRGPPEIA